jgi:pilus assembly protein Flp/PilA
VKRLAFDTTGTTAIEYALIATLISIAIVTAATAAGTKLSALFAAVAAAP